VAAGSGVGEGDGDGVGVGVGVGVGDGVGGGMTVKVAEPARLQVRPQTCAFTVCLPAPDGDGALLNRLVALHVASTATGAPIGVFPQ
jgi:hypothetical protein